jgi:hypothetical protein
VKEVRLRRLVQILTLVVPPASFVAFQSRPASLVLLIVAGCDSVGALVAYNQLCFPTRRAVLYAGVATLGIVLILLAIPLVMYWWR